MGSALESVYRFCPVWMQNIGVSAYGLMWKWRRQGGVFRTQVRAFASREEWTSSQWEAYQTEQLRALLAHCFTEVSHYRAVWEAQGLTEETLSRFTLADLPRLPFTEKDDIRRAPESFLARTTPPKKLHTYHTSGSTGTPLAIRMRSSTHQTIQAAYEARCRNWAGVNYQMSRAMIGGRLVVPHGSASPPFWRYNRVERQLYLSAFHISPANVPDYVGALNRFHPDYLVGYASAHFFLARLIEETKLSVYSPKAILTSSEKLTDEMRATLERVYRAPVFDGYSGVESCCLASECEYHRLHVSPDVGIVELIGEDGQPVPPGQEGEIVATGLINLDQPLIRYRTGDMAAWSTDPCPCGREMPVLRELIGRLEDTVIGPDGRETVRFHGITIGIPAIRESQIIQETLSHFVVKVVAPDGLTEADRAKMIARFHERLGPVEVEILLVETIERTARGKYRAVISKVPRAQQRTAG
jgi:phenylacetate-CoA ligase